MISIQQLPAENIILTGEAKVQAWNHRADPNTQCLIATGVQTCVAMTVFDRENHVGAVAHFDSPNGVRQSIDTLQDKFSQIGGG